jgi:2,4-dienoyl-CoA reductase-like NADH-dependent reductase (Old Yellow Enzyme family)
MAPMTRRFLPLEANGVPIPPMIPYYAKRAEGEVALIITEGVHVDDRHSIDDPHTPRIYNVEQVRLVMTADGIDWHLLISENNI